MVATANILGPNIGKDASISIIDSLGNTYTQDQLGILTNISVKMKTKHIETDSLTQGGMSWNTSIPKGITVSIKFKRWGTGLATLLTNYWNQWYAGNIINYTLQIRVQNRDGTINTYVIGNCVPLEGDYGDFNPDADVTQDIRFEGSTITNS
jgi:hypothetical protein